MRNCLNLWNSILCIAAWAARRLGCPQNGFRSAPRLAFLAFVLNGASLGWTTPTEDEFLRQMNLGKASLENRDSAEAIKAFSAALRLQSESAPAWRNLARAQMLANRLDDAHQALLQARALEPKSAATVYLLGLIQSRHSKFQEAVLFFEEAVRLDPNLAPLRFQLANAYQFTRQNEKARAQLEETVRLDPLHASAHFKLAMAARQSRDLEGYRTHNETFQHLRRLFGDDQRTPTALERCRYTRPEAAVQKADLPGPALPVRFTDQTIAAFSNLPGPLTNLQTAAVLDVETNGLVALFVLNAQGTPHLLGQTNQNGSFAPLPLSAEIPSTIPYQDAIAGNVHDEAPAGVKYDPLLHARNDLLLFGTNGLCLLEQNGPSIFTNVTTQSGLSEIQAQAAAWVDYDQDGDLDLILAQGESVQLWQNNGNRQFQDVTKQAGLDSTTPAWAVVAADLDQNLGVDLLVAGGSAHPSLVFKNQRTGQFRRQAEPPGPAPVALGVLANDLNNDGALDVVWWTKDRAVIKAGGEGGEFTLAFPSLQAITLTLLDFDNDGWLDLCAIGRPVASPQAGAVALWRNLGGFRWQEVTEITALASISLPPLRRVVPADFDADGDTDILLLSETGSPHFLRNEGGQANARLQVRLQGTKTNPMGLGTQIEVRAGDFWITRTVSQWPVEIGLGNRRRLDSVKTIWTNGIEDNQMNVQVGIPPLSIPEKNVAAGSCPYLYVWDGHRFRFVTDLLGNSPLGLSLRRGEVLAADPDEWVWAGNETNLQPRDGHYEIEITEELREVLYLDHAQWMAVDHLPSVEVHSNDKLGPPPFAVSDLQPVEILRIPLRALGDDGIDRTKEVQCIDQDFGLPGPPLPPPLRGLRQPLALTLDFGDFDFQQPLVLALTGWLQYGDASVNIAASQNSTLPVIPPRLEAEHADGTWTVVDPSVGMPSGKTKTILCSLTGKLPPDTRALRLVTTFEIRWDRLALARPVSTNLLQKHLLPLESAELYFRGFSDIRPRGPGFPATPDYDQVQPRPPWRTTPQGWCTKYGDVLDLVSSRDDRLVLLNGGDAVRLRFSARDLPPVAPGLRRSFFFYSVGWDKDADPNVVDGDTVEPLPVTKQGEWFEQTATRWVSGRWQPSP